MQLQQKKIDRETSWQAKVIICLVLMGNIKLEFIRYFAQQSQYIYLSSLISLITLARKTAHTHTLTISFSFLFED